MSSTILIPAQGKDSLTLDLKSAEGRKILFELVSQTDIFVENFSKGGTERLCIDYAVIKAINFRLVYTSISGFRAASAAGRKAMDAIIKGLSGIMYTIGEEVDPPMRMSIPLDDLVAPSYGVIKTLAALRQGEQTEQGQLVDI